MTGLGRDAGALFVTFYLAGLLASWIVVPERLGGWDRLFLSFALAVPATLLASAPGIATHHLEAWNVGAGVLALAVAAAYRARRGLSGLAGRARRVSLSLSRSGAIRLLLICAALAATWFAVLVPEGIESTGSGRPNGTIVYYHWGIVGDVAADGGLPSTLPEWGRPREFPYEYAFSVMHGAATAKLAGRSGFVLEERYRIAMVVSALLAALALWSCWLPIWWAGLAALLTMNVSRVETRLLVYKPEAFAFILVLWSAWLLDRALQRRSKRLGALAGLVLATSFLAHPVGSLLVAPLWGGILLGRAVPWIWPRVKSRAALSVDRLALGVVAWSGGVFAALFVALRTVIGSTAQQLAQNPVDGVDATRVVYNLAYVSANPFARPRVPECSQPFGVYSTVRPFFSSNASWFFFDIHARSSVFLIVGGLVLLGGVFLAQRPPRLSRWPPRAKRGVITWVSYGVGVYLLALLICVYYSTWVPQRVGPMRLMPYWALIFPGLIAAVCWVVARLLSTWAPARWRRRSGEAGWLGGGVVAIPALLVASLAIWAFTTVSANQDRGVPAFYIAAPRAGGLSGSALRAYAWMKRNLPANAVVLANGYTEGALGSLSERTGLLDGRTPFEQPDPWRAEAIHWLSESRAFFRSPRSVAIPGGAGYVLAARHSVNLGGSYFPTDFAALEGDQGLVLIHRFAGISLYRTRSSGPIPVRHLSGTTSAAVTRSTMFAANQAWSDFRDTSKAGAFGSPPPC